MVMKEPKKGLWRKGNWYNQNILRQGKDLKLNVWKYRWIGRRNTQISMII